MTPRKNFNVQKKKNTEMVKMILNIQNTFLILNIVNDKSVLWDLSQVVEEKIK